MAGLELHARGLNTARHAKDQRLQGELQMKPPHLRPLLGAALLFASTAALATTHYSKMVIHLQIAPANADCIYFQLEGVATADSAVSPSPFFALYKTHPGYTQAYAMLLTAKMTGTAVNVTTTGAVANSVCGTYAGVHDIQMP
jgi:hypothetical protein